MIGAGIPVREIGLKKNYVWFNKTSESCFLMTTFSWIQKFISYKNPSNSQIAIPPGRCILTITLLSWKPVMLCQYLQMGYQYNQWHLQEYRKCMISKESWYLLILILVYPSIFQITPGDDNYLLYIWLGEQMTIH